MRVRFLHGSIRRYTLFSLIVLAASMATWWGCSQREQTVAPSESDLSVSRFQFSATDPRILAVMQVQNRHTAALMANPDIVGTATGVNDAGVPSVLVFAASENAAQTVPAEFDGVPVVTQVTGRIVAKKSGGGGASHRVVQTLPIQLGTSGGWRYDLANGYCCGGTLGSLIQKGGTQYVLSNYHVLYSDIVSGGNGRTAQPGDPVIQPGLIDVGCNASTAHNVATLVNGGGSLPGHNVDVGYAQVIPGAVNPSGAILEVGTISAAPVAAFVGQGVKKSGRTTGLSRSSVSGLNGSFSITYENECAGGTSFTQSYTGQIVISNPRCGFLDGGDSGSLMVEDVTTNPHPVGLLFAGSSICARSAIAIANPIQEVLNWAGATMVGQ